MRLHTLERSPGRPRRRKRLGRGCGSGVGKTCGKGHKGQMARKGHKHKPGFEGGQMPLIRRQPKVGFKSHTGKRYEVVNVEDLSKFDAGAEVTAATLAQAGLVKGVKDGIKLLGAGSIDRKLTVRIHAFSASAKEKVEQAGGVCEVVAN